MLGFRTGNDARHHVSVVGLGVALRLDRTRLSVADEAEQHAVDGGLVRHAQPQHRLVAEIVRPLEDVRVGAVVMRLREQCGRRGLRAVGDAVPLIP